MENRKKGVTSVTSHY